MNWHRIEFIIATAIYLFSLIFIYSNSIDHWGERYVASYMGCATVIYGVFALFTQWIWPCYFRKRKIELGAVLTLLLFFFSWIGLSVCVWIRHYAVYQSTAFWPHLTRGESLAVSLLLFLSLFAYEGLRHSIVLVRTSGRGLSKRIIQESLVVLGGGIAIFLFLLSLAESLAALWLSAVPYAYTIYALNIYWLLPLREKRHHSLVLYLAIAIGLSFVIFIPFGIFFLNVSRAAGAVFFFEWICIILIVIPLANLVYRRQKERIAQLVNLQLELGQTSADLSFLRSQINPHFLFNILNTLYGTALQEKADRTASSIQKLGDMMRFMLHENNQDKILLSREVEYLRNYIDLQLLRTATSPGITVEHTIHDALSNTYIAPMLLIPFVENAFKHGISLQEKSWIKISLYEADGRLFFDVHNSIHRKPDSDPERRHSGIGLENVKQRLAMLYPGRHDLVIRETTQEFFIHLTVIC
ncbi:Histidine kinase [Parapedobacter luteus]|uniref:Histidine kinase n=1 Tax=Parapedobacter luteus TaxID=623280 RepID=A0A1T5F9E8_9SPHI|nr:histidine kinase [Parapedobacter luteus]SKB92803.1 Histidine kinase [Parapedobacter luteus]